MSSQRARFKALGSTVHPGRIAGALGTSLLLQLGCSESPPPPTPPPSGLLQPARLDPSALATRLPELLPFAEVEVETDEVNFKDLVDGSALKDGWSLEPTLDKAWSIGGKSTLEFKVFPVRDLELSFRSAPFHYAGSSDQTVTVAVNGRELERLKLWKMTRSYRVHIPAPALRFGTNRLEFSYGYTAVPSEVVEGSDDSRQLAVLWDWIRFGEAREPIPPPEVSSDGTRLDIPFGSRISYYLQPGVGSTLRLGALEVWADEPESAGSLRSHLLIEISVDGSDETRVVEVAPGQFRGAVEIALPVERTWQRARVALSTYQTDGARGGIPGESRGPYGLSLDLPEIVSVDEEILARARDGDTAVTRMPLPVRPNVLIYLIDTLRADHLGAYGYPYDTSPNIDRFALEATLFSRAVAQASWTKPSVASIFTGLNPQLHGVNARKDALSAEASTMAEMLWESGYDTAAIFTNGNLSHMGLGQGFATYRHLREGTHDAIHVLSDSLNEVAFRWLGTRDRSKPFFLYLHATDPHSPYAPGDSFLSALGREVADPSVGLMESVNQLRRNKGEKRQIDDLLALYDAEIAQNDHYFGLLLQELDRQGLLEDTLVVLVSDHGEEFFDHGWWQHGKTLYEEQLSVPLIMRFPGGVGRGQVVDDIAQHIDILPTVLDTVGIDIPAGLPGRSLLGLIESGATAPPAYAMSYLSLDNRLAESVLTDDGKLILHHYEEPTQGQLLFDLISDPAERNNLWARRPVLTGHLLAALRAFDLRHQDRLDPEQGEFDEELIERLKALGYLNQ